MKKTAEKKPKKSADVKVEGTRETHPIDALKPHPKNYYGHPDDQLAHIVESIKTFGFYRRVIVADDLTILAGHGLTAAAKKMGLTEAPVLRLNIPPDHPKALKLLAGDNNISHLAEIDDRTLSQLLKDINEMDGLAGTGFDEKMLAALVMITRPSSEIQDHGEAAQWVGMPEFGVKDEQIRITVLFRNKKDREKFVETFKLAITTYKAETAWTTWWPAKARDDLESVRFETNGSKKPTAKKPAAKKRGKR